MGSKNIYFGLTYNPSNDGVGHALTLPFEDGNKCLGPDRSQLHLAGMPYAPISAVCME